MKTPMRAIKIDVIKKIIYEVNIVGFEDIQKEIGCDCFTTAFNLPRYDVCFVDDEGLLKEVKGWFKFEGLENPFAGNGLIVGGDAQGETRKAKISLLEVASKVQFSIN